jgi:hypothetical protein
MPDEKPPSESSTEDLEEKQKLDESLESSEADTEKSEGDESQKSSKRDKRIQQLVDQRKEAQDIVDWYRENIGDPEDVLEFRRWKADQVKKAEKAEKEGDLSPAKLKEIRDLMRKADPEYADFIRQQKEDRESRLEAQFDTAEEKAREFAKSIGIAQDNEKAIRALGRQIMLEIDSDEKLKRMWYAGNLDCIPKAIKIVEESLIGAIRKSKPEETKQQAKDKRRISRLPTLPSASGTVSQNEKRPPGEKGITKATHDEAWALVQQAMHE